jgi:CheY-like chemotaxis protein
VKVLVVDPDSRRAPLLQETLMTGGAEVTVASSGSFALTMLEWNRHDVVVSRGHIDDMAGHELCAILKADPGTREVRFVLVAGPEEVTPTESAAAGVDLVLPPSMTGSAILPLVVRLMEANRTPASEPGATPAPVAPTTAPSPSAAITPPAGSSPSAPPAAPSATVPPVLAPREVAPPPPATGVPRIRPDAAPPLKVDPPKRYATAATDTTGPWSNAPRKPAPSAPAAPAGVPSPAPASPARPPVAARTAVPPKVEDLLAMPSGTFQGSLEVMELADLTQAIAGGGKSGRLILALPQGGGLILFEKGRVVHAEYRNTVGEEAFGALLAACHADGAGRFCFLPTPTGEASGMPRTIDKTVDRLLLSSATAIDEKG